MELNYERFCNRQNLLNKMTKLTLSLYDNEMTPRSDVQKTVESMIDFIAESYIPFLQNDLEINLKNSVKPEILGKIKCLLDDNKYPLEDFKTESLRFKIYERESDFFMPKRHVIGKTPDTGEEIEIVNVPLGKTLKNFLQLPGVYNSIQKNMEKLKKTPKPGETKVVKNILQATLYKTRYNDDSRNVIPLFFSYDDAEARGPLTSHAGEEKLGLGYISIPVLEPHLVANLDNVFLALVFLAKHKKHLKNIDIFGPLVKELMELSEIGIVVKVGGIEEKVYFECLLIVGDNLGLNEICGFVASFNANYYCRICYATSAECKEMLKEIMELLRDEFSYALDVLNKSRGVLEECIFNRLKRFHIVYNRTLDIMHDLLEGEGKDTVELVLTEIIIKEKQISLAEFNLRLKKFDFGYEKSNRPRPLKTERCSPSDEKCYGSKMKIKAKQSASQMACLIRYLPFILDELIPTGKDYWKLYIYLRKIVGIVTAPQYLESDLYQVSLLIENYLSIFSRLLRMKPKPHFMVHIPLIMRFNGPMVHYWSMATERKHRFAKKVAMGTASSIDLPWTIAIKNQLMLCRRKEVFKYTDVDYELGPTKSDTLTSFRIKQHYTGTESCKLYKYLTMFGHQFSSGTIFAHGCDENGETNFLKLNSVVEIKDELYFYVCTLHTKFFNENYHAYEIVMNDIPNKLIPIQEVERKPPCLLYTNVNNEHFVACRYD